VTATKVLLAGAILLCPLVSQAKIIPYPGALASLDEAIQSAASGDTVLVAPGKYTETFRMKSGVVLRSSAGRDSTIIVSPGTGLDPLKERLIECIGVDSTTVIEGFTLDHGKSNGAAIYCENSYLTIRENLISGFGWGIDLRRSPALVVGNIVERCTPFAVLILSCSPKLYRNEIRNNASTAIDISGNKSTPDIGGSKENANKFYGNQGAIRVSGRKDVAAQWNDWGWETTAEMEREGYPSDIIAITDGNDFGKSHRGRGKIDYRNWIKPPPVKQASSGPRSQPNAGTEAGSAGGASGEGSANRVVPWAAGAILVGIFVAFAARRKRVGR
jgi:hypothetical protein